MNHRVGVLVAVVIVEPAIIVPIADASFGLPRQRLDLGAGAPFHIPDHGFLLVFVEHLAQQDALVLAVMPKGIAVVVAGGDFQAHVADRIKRKNRVVEINHVGMIFVNQVHRAVVKFLAVGGIRHATSFFGVPIPHEFVRGNMALCIQVLRIETVPPLARAVRLGLHADLRRRTIRHRD